MSIAGHSGSDEGGDEILAAEYVVGTLPADEREALSRRIASDPAFARVVDRWERDLSPMNDGFAAVEPPAGLKAEIDRRLFASNPGEQQPAATARGGLWQSLALWRGVAIASLVALGFILAQPYLAPTPETPAQRLVASLAPQQSDVHYFVVYDARAADIGLSHVTGARAEGRDFELWVIEGSQPPASLGIIPAGATVHIGVDAALRRKIEAGAVFAVSLEPVGGSPTGQPTGPVVAAGDLRNI